MRVDPAPNIESLFQKLEQGRADVAGDALVSYCVVRKLGFKDIHMLEPGAGAGKAVEPPLH